MFKFAFIVVFIIFFLLFLVGFSVFRTIKGILFGGGKQAPGDQTRSQQRNQQQSSQSQPKHQKLFEKDEGEYIDFEEVE